MRVGIRHRCIRSTCLVLLLLTSQGGWAHGGVGMEGGQCLIRMGNLEARFTGYQPETRGSKEFCDDLPDMTQSIFVLEFVHDVLKIMPMDFRVIRDDQDFGLGASSKDIRSLSDIDSMTEYYMRPTLFEGGRVNAKINFTRPGLYIGIITARHPASGEIFEAVFPFRVGAIDYSDYWPLFIIVLITMQVFYSRSADLADASKSVLARLARIDLLARNKSA
ncbi:MAG: hypothetical protein COB04_01060 [Gammaproteobacteria bacterium]|nr:MAG: hypothetical protein COB04_01060 [Gammaproteobacteria bacterium]